MSLLKLSGVHRAACEPATRPERLQMWRLAVLALLLLLLLGHARSGTLESWVVKRCQDDEVVQQADASTQGFQGSESYECFSSLSGEGTWLHSLSSSAPGPYKVLCSDGVLGSIYMAVVRFEADDDECEADADNVLKVGSQSALEFAGANFLPICSAEGEELPCIVTGVPANKDDLCTDTPNGNYYECAQDPDYLGGSWLPDWAVKALLAVLPGTLLVLFVMARPVRESLGKDGPPIPTAQLLRMVSTAAGAALLFASGLVTLYESAELLMCEDLTSGADDGELRPIPPGHMCIDVWIGLIESEECSMGKGCLHEDLVQCLLLW